MTIQINFCNIFLDLNRVMIRSIKFLDSIQGFPVSSAPPSGAKQKWHFLKQIFQNFTQKHFLHFFVSHGIKICV